MTKGGRLLFISGVAGLALLVVIMLSKRLVPECHSDVSRVKNLKPCATASFSRAEIFDGCVTRPPRKS
jgi:hypothetical protein